MIEEWRKIEGYPNYSVSNLGRVRNDATGRFLSQAKSGCRRSYLYVLLYDGTHASRKTMSIHRLVANAFIPNPDNKPEVNHLDGNGFNNVVSNLEWVTHTENLIHAHKVLGYRRKSIAGSANGNSKKVVRLEDGKIFDTVKDAAIACGTHYTCISQCLNGGPHRHTAGGYHWKYADITR